MGDQPEQPIFELRRYQIKPGELDRWVDWMDTEAIPFLRSIGMTIVGSWCVRESNQYVWIRRFENQSDKERLSALQYGNSIWVREMRPIVNEMLDRESGLEITEMEASPLSIIR